MSDKNRIELENQWKILCRGTVDILPRDELKNKLKECINGDRAPLRVKQGFDPTSPDIHIGHTVGIRKLKQFQDLGHQVVLIVGDYTAMVGDPSARTSTRPRLSYDKIMKNAETYQEQFFRILDKSKTEVRYNGERLKEMNFMEVMELATKFTVARLLERDDFSKRLKKGNPISIHELFYPLMQGYDSVAIKADVELGATEQTFNLLAGRTIQESYGVEAQSVLTMPILVGLDGEKKMSKTLGNYIGVDESPREIFGKAMSIPDNLILQYFELATDIPIDELSAIKEQLQDSSINPMTIKKQLAERLVEMYNSTGSGINAREEFERVFSKKKLPDEIPQISIEEIKKLGLDPSKVFLVHLITKSNMTKSGGEARKLISAGAVTLDDKKIIDPNYEFEIIDGMILKVGKRRYLQLTNKS